MTERGIREVSFRSVRCLMHTRESYTFLFYLRLYNEGCKLVGRHRYSLYDNPRCRLVVWVSLLFVTYTLHNIASLHVDTVGGCPVCIDSKSIYPSHWLSGVLGGAKRLSPWKAVTSIMSTPKGYTNDLACAALSCPTFIEMVRVSSQTGNQLPIWMLVASITGRH
ncbi:hypothetical protein F4776DRAFT_365196 [Hypoxylon sp. NC0597]|nr:hypothetical protein F4776DRAFT_365196 [Hypoxylon sp. NC0597]